MERLNHATAARNVQRLVALWRRFRLFGYRSAVTLQPSAKPVVDLHAHVVAEAMRQRSGEPGDLVRMPQHLVNFSTLLIFFNAVVDVIRRVRTEEVAAAHLDLQRLGRNWIERIPPVEPERRRSGEV